MNYLINNISLYIPHVFANIGKEKIINTFHITNIGKVSNVDFVAKMGNDGRPYNSAYIHFDNWYNTDSAYHFQERVLDSEKEAKLIYDEPWYWIVLENKAKKHMPGDRKPRIIIDNDLTIFRTPTKTPQELPAAPIKEKRPCNLGGVDQTILDRQLFDVDEMMDAEEEQMEEENSHLAYFDTRYVASLEQENSYLHNKSEHEKQMLNDEIMCLKAELSLLKEKEKSFNKKAHCEKKAV